MTGITFDAEQARLWLDSPSPEDTDLTVAAELGVDDDSDFGYETGLDFDARLEDLVGRASSAGLFGSGWAVSVWLVRDGDGRCDGGLVTVDVPGERPLRLAGLHVDHKHLTDDRSAVGQAAAVAALSTIADQAAQIVTGANLGGERVAPYTGADLTEDQLAALSEAVHDAAANRAADAINNGEQAALLVDLGWTPDMIRAAAGVPA